MEVYSRTIVSYFSTREPHLISNLRLRVRLGHRIQFGSVVWAVLLKASTSKSRLRSRGGSRGTQTAVASQAWELSEGLGTHGTFISSTVADGGMPSVTGGETVSMSTPTLEDFTRQVSSAPRPSLLSQQSNSLPSTPYVHARKLSDESRIPPSSGKRVEITSPRSARSESDTAIRSPGRTPFLARCKYETGMAFSRRRIPYSLGGDKLESIGGVLKQALNVEEEQTLSGDIQELYSQILPSVESEDRRMTFVKKLEHILNKEWPGNSIKVHVFGSSENMLCTNDSDGG